jgi:hypothetical protein
MRATSSALALISSATVALVAAATFTAPEVGVASGAALGAATLVFGMMMVIVHLKSASQSSGRCCVCVSHVATPFVLSITIAIVRYARNPLLT